MELINGLFKLRMLQLGIYNEYAVPPIILPNDQANDSATLIFTTESQDAMRLIKPALEGIPVYSF